MTHEPVPHADRDHSEQPFTPEQIERLRTALLSNTPTPSTATAGSDPTQGTSRSASARVVRASEAQVEAARLAWHRQARAVADAVVAAGDANEVTLAEHGRNVREVARQVYGAEIERLRAEVERLTGSLEVALERLNRDGDPVDLVRFARLHIEAALEGRSRPFAMERARAEAAEAERDEIAGRLSALLCELTGGRLSKTTYDVRTMVAEIDSVYDDAQREERAERDRLAEVVARVEALADEWEGYGHGEFNIHPDVDVANSCAACAIVRGLRAALSGPTPAQTPATDAPQGPGAMNGAPGQSGTTCGGCGAQWPDLHVYHPGPGGTLCVKCGWTPDDGTPTAAAAEDAEGHSGTGQALGGAENGVPSIGDTCCGKCPGGTCYVDGVTGA